MAVEVKVMVHKDDVERLMQAFKEGKLADLGIVEVKLAEAEKAGRHQGAWSSGESNRRRSPRKKETPPRA